MTNPIYHVNICQHSILDDDEPSLNISLSNIKRFVTLKTEDNYGEFRRKVVASFN